MAETTSATTSKGKPKPVAIGATGSELPKFEMPRFEMPKFEIPTAFREFAEKGIAQARENYEKAKTAAEEATDVFEDTYSTATKGCASYGLKLIETTRANSDAAFDLMSDVMNAKSYSEVIELYSAFVRKQFDTFVGAGITMEGRRVIPVPSVVSGRCPPSPPAPAPPTRCTGTPR